MTDQIHISKTRSPFGSKLFLNESQNLVFEESKFQKTHLIVCYYFTLSKREKKRLVLKFTMLNVTL